MVGASYGGSVAMNQAIRTPGRVASIALLNPAGLTRLDARFWLWLSISRQPGRAGTGVDDAHVGRHPRLPGGAESLAILTDDELRAITVPALLITGVRSALLTPQEARARGSLTARAGRHRPRQPRRFQPDQRTERPNRRLHQSPGHQQVGGSAATPHGHLNSRERPAVPNPARQLAARPGTVRAPPRRRPSASTLRPTDAERVILARHSMRAAPRHQTLHI